MMKTRTLGRDLAVSAVGLGCMGFSHAYGAAMGEGEAVPLLRRAAEENGIAYQDEVLTAGGTDSAAMQQSKAGVLAGCISIPCRYIHSPNEMVSLQDVEQCARLMALAAGQAL